MKLKPSATFGDVSAICQELAGLVPSARRFSGLCNTPLAAVSRSSPPSGLSWNATVVAWTKSACRPLFSSFKEEHKMCHMMHQAAAAGRLVRATYSGDSYKTGAIGDIGVTA